MATRRVTTVFAVEGESGYRAAVAGINRELKTLSSGLTLVTAEYKNNANSISALQAKSDALTAVFAKQAARVESIADAMDNCQESLDKYTAKQSELAAALKANEDAMSVIDRSAEGAAEAYQELNHKNEQLCASMNENAARMKAASSGVQEWQTKLNSAKTDLLETGDALEETNRYLDEAKSSADGFATSIDGTGKKIKDVGSAADEAGGKVDDFGKNGAAAMTSVAGAVVSSGLARLFRVLADAVAECVNSSIEFESAITGVYKTVDGTDAQLESITRGIKDMALAIPLTTSELAGIAEAAGQLGIATDDILSFTEVIAQLASATNLSAEEASTSLAKFANITGLAASEYSNLGSALVALGNNFATTESDILAMSMRIAAAGTQIGLSQAQILGFSAALSSLGLEAEAGGTAFSTALKEIQIAVETGSDDLERFSEVAGMTSQAFSKLWSEDSSAAITAFINGLGDIDSKSGSTIAMLEEIGFSGIRLSDTWTRLSSNATLVGDAVSMATQAFSENVALAEEAATRYSTVESKIALMQNAFAGLEVAFGDSIKATLEPAIEGATSLLAALTGLVEESPAISGAIAGIVAAFASLAGIAAATTAVKAFVALGGSLATIINPCTVAVAALAALSAGIAVYVSNIPDANAETRAFAESVSEMNGSFESAKDSYDELVDSIDGKTVTTDALLDELEKLLKITEKTAAQKALVLEIIDELNAQVPSLALSYNSVTDSINRSTASIRTMALEINQTAKLEAAAERLKNLYIAQYEAAQVRNKAQKDYAEALKEEAAAEAAYNEAIASGTGDVYNKARAWENAIEKAELLKGALDESVKVLADNTVAALNAEDSYNELAKSMEDIGSAAEKASGSIADVGSSAALSAKSVSDLKSLLPELESAYSDISEGVEDVYDALVKALENRSQQMLKATKENNARILKQEKSDSADRIKVWEDEYNTRSKLLSDSTYAVVGSLQGRIDATEALTKAEKEAAAAAEWNSTLAGYGSDIGAASADVASYGSGMSSVLASYEQKAAGVVEEYSDRIAKAEAAKAEAVRAAQETVSRAAEEYASRLASLDAGSQEYAALQYELAQKLSEYNSELVEAERGGNEAVLFEKRAQAEAEEALALEKRDALIAVAESLGAADVSVTQKYNESKLALESSYAQKIAGVKASASKSAAEKAKETATLQGELDGKLYDLRQSYEKNLESTREKSREAAKKAAEELAKLEIKKAQEVGEYEYDQILLNRDAKIESLNAQIDLVKTAADELQSKYDTAFESQKAQEESRLSALEEYYAQADNIAQARYDESVKNEAARQEALKLLAAGSQEDILDIIETYNPQWANAGRTAADELANGWKTSEQKLKEAVGESISGAVAELDELGKKIKEIYDLIDDWGGDRDSKVYENIGSTFAESLEKYDKQANGAGLSLAKSAIEGIRTGLDMHSPSRVLISLGEQAGESFASGIADTADLIRETSEDAFGSAADEAYKMADDISDAADSAADSQNRIVAQIVEFSQEFSNTTSALAGNLSSGIGAGVSADVRADISVSSEAEAETAGNTGSLAETSEEQLEAVYIIYDALCEIRDDLAAVSDKLLGISSEPEIASGNIDVAAAEAALAQSSTLPAGSVTSPSYSTRNYNSNQTLQFYTPVATFGEVYKAAKIALRKQLYGV